MADVKTAYGASAQYAFAVEALASSTTRTAGRESTAIANTANKYLDYIISGKVMTGTTPTVDKQIDLWVYAAFKDTPTYPDVLDGTDSAETIVSANVRDGALVLAASIRVDATSNQAYYFAPFSLARLFGGVVPTHHGLFLAHDTVAALHATAGNHEFWYTPVYLTVV